MKALAMGDEKPSVADILRRVDELIRILKFLSEDLAELSGGLKAFLVATGEEQSVQQPLRPPTSAQQTIPLAEPIVPTLQEVRTVDDVQKAFPQDLAGMLYFEATDEYVLIKPRQYLGSDNFRRIASTVRDQLGGEYVSAGRDSHFRIPRRT